MCDASDWKQQTDGSHLVEYDFVLKPAQQIAANA